MAKAAAEAKLELSLVDRITGPIRRIQARLANLSRKLGIDRIARATGNLTRRIGGLGDALARSTSRLGLFATALGAGAGGAVAAAFSLANQTASLGDEIAKTAKTIGLTAEELQELRYAAELSGVAQEKLDSSMLAFTKRLGEAKQGTGEAKQALKELGVSMAEIEGKTPIEVLELVADRLKDVQDPLERNAILSDLFSRAGIRMGNMLVEGAAGLRSMRQEARETGHVMSNATTDFAEEFNDNVTRLTSRLKGLRNTLGVHLMPVMNELVVNVTGWIDANRELVKSSITEWVGRFARVLRDLMDPASEIRQRISAMAESVSGLMDRIAPVVEFLGGPMNTALLTIAAYIAGPLVMAVAALSGAFINLGVAIMTTPVGWILAGVAAIGASAYVLIQKWDEFVAYWSGMWGRVRAGFEQGFWQGFFALWKEFNPVVHIARGIDAVVEYFTGVSLIDQASALVDSFMDGFAGLAGRLRTRAREAGSSVGEGFRSASMDVAGWLGEKFDAAIEYLKTLPAVFYRLGADIVTGIWDGIKSQWAALKEWFAGAVRDLVPDWAPDWLKNGLGFGASGGDSAEGGGRPTIEAPSIQTPSIGPREPLAREFGLTLPRREAPIEVPNAAPGGMMKTKEVEAGAVNVGEFNIPEPLMVHKPTEVMLNQQITINATTREGMGAAEIEAATLRAIEAENRRAAADIQSSLSD